MPRILRRAPPAPASNRAEPIDNRIEYNSLRVAAFPEAGAGHRLHSAMSGEGEDAIRVENGNFQLPLQLLQQPEHPIDRTA